MMPIKVKLDNTDNNEDDDAVALAILAGYKEGLEESEEDDEEAE